MSSRNRRNHPAAAAAAMNSVGGARSSSAVPYPAVAAAPYPPAASASVQADNPPAPPSAALPGTSAGPGGASDFQIHHPAASIGTGAGGGVAEVDEALMDAESGKPSDPDLFEAKSLFVDSYAMLKDFYSEGRMCDVTLRVGTASIRCHRIVLACVSLYFRSMFQSEMMESRQSEVTIKDLDEESVKLLVDFCYTGKLHLTVNNVQMLMYASSILQMDLPAKACSEFMIRNLDPINCVGVRAFAEAHGRSDLIDCTVQYTEEHFQDVRLADDFHSVPYDFLVQLLKSDNLNVSSEKEVYETVVNWVQHDSVNRSSLFPTLLEHVRLILLPPEFLLKTVGRSDLVRNDLHCRDLVDEAKSYHLERHHDQRLASSVQPRKTYAGVVFCVGGRGSFGDPFKSIECFDIRKDVWFPVADMSTKRRHVGVVSVGDKLYAIGGHDGIRHLNSGEIFDPRTNKWKPMASMSTLRRGLAVACLRGTIYALGGLDDQTCYRAVERYDVEADAWSQVQSLNVPRGGVAVSTVTDHNNHSKDYLYAVGGNDGSASLDSCERYDPLLNKWTLLSSMSKRRAGAGCSELNGYIFVVGGFDDNAPLDTCERYDPQTNQWLIVARMSCPRGGVGVATLAGKIFAVGGHDGTNYLNSAEAYDAATDTWQPIGSVGSCRAGAGTAFCNIPIAEVRRDAAERDRVPSVNSCV